MSFSFPDAGVRERNIFLGVQVEREALGHAGTRNQLSWQKERGNGCKMKRVTRRFVVQVYNKGKEK